MYTYDTLDQLTQINQAGQLRTFDYDGHGRLSSRATPEQGTTTYTYNTDDTLLKITDARGATTSFVYNNRHLPTSITYGLAAGVAATPNVTLVYDAAGNRTSMVEKISAVTVGSSAYHYDSLARMDWEERTIPAVDTYRLTYAYNLSGELTNLTGPSQFGSIGVGYTYDKTGRPSTVTGANYGGVSSYASNIKYRAWSGLKSMSYGDSKALSTTYDSRMRATKWDVPGVMGWNYAYNYFNENTGRVTYAQNLYDATLDRSYDYDNVGRLIEAHTGSEARGALVGQGGAQDGPYSHSYRYDPQGNMWYRVGWGGSFNPWLEQWPQFTNNRLTTNPWTGAAMTYDAAGNLTNDGYQTYTYDAMGQQATASAGVLAQSYDGDGLRVKKTESGVTTYYLRSTVLGGQVVNEIDQSGGLGRGYVYLGGQMLAIQNGGSISWVHQDPVTKSQRITNQSGAVTSTIDLDPWGGETSRSSNAAFQPHRYTTYERDANGGDEAMMRRYTAKWHRFDQPDPYDGSYSLADPQSFNRYSYVQNDPVNFVDPSGLETCYTDIDGKRVCIPDIGGTVNIPIPPDPISWDDLPGADGHGAGGPVIRQPQNPATICPPVQFKVTGIGPNQAPRTTAISQTPRANIPDGDVAIKPRNFGVKGVNGGNRDVFLNMRFIVDWSTDHLGAPPNIPTQGPFRPADNIGPSSVRNAAGNQIDVYNYKSQKDALTSTRTVLVTTIIPINKAGVKCPQ